MTSMRKIAVVNMKGGVGKTTTAIHIAAGLAQSRRRVLLLDVDPQGNVGHSLGLRHSRTILELMTGEASLEAVTIAGVRPGLDVIASNPAAFALERRLAGETQRETILARRLRGAQGYDAIVIDGCPAMNLLTYNALLFAEEIVIPVGMDLMAIIGARQTLQGILELRELWPERRLDILAVLPTFVHSTNHATRATLEALEQDAVMGAHVFLPGIRQCIDLNYATARRQTIWEYAPRSRAAEDYARFVAFVENPGLGREQHVTEQQTGEQKGGEEVLVPAQGQAQV
jgi:chromosome partitioning protein